MNAIINIEKVTVSMKVNINDRCRVKPTELGWKILAEKCPYYKLCMGFKDDGYFTTELWDLMSIFGEHMYMGAAKQVFEKNIMEFEMS